MSSFPTLNSGCRWAWATAPMEIRRLERLRLNSIPQSPCAIQTHGARLGRIRASVLSVRLAITGSACFGRGMAWPGSAEKIRVLEDRVRNGQLLRHPLDRDQLPEAIGEEVHRGRQGQTVRDGILSLLAGAHDAGEGADDDDDA